MGSQPFGRTMPCLGRVFDANRDGKIEETEAKKSSDPQQALRVDPVVAKAEAGHHSILSLAAATTNHHHKLMHTLE